MRDMTQRFMVALIALALTSGAFARDAVVGRESDAAVRARVIELVNDARARGARCGSKRYGAAPPLKPSSQITDAAIEHARDMARLNFFEHRGADGSHPKDRLRRAGYESRLTGENIA